MNARVAELTPRELAARIEQGDPLALLDVREPFERNVCAIAAGPGVVDLHIPLGQIPAALDRIEDQARGRDLVVYCHHGVRSMHVAAWLAERGFSSLANLAGGIDAWSVDVDPTVPRY